MNTGDCVTISEPYADTLFRLIGAQGAIDFFYGWELRYYLFNADHLQGRPFEVERERSHQTPARLEDLAAQMDQGNRRMVASRAA
ncbi:MAG: hypothetical protein OXH93_06810 [Caldilineaceae bacterium]|nr:hypothetical protein [Caldilineaceae bacterium]